MNVKLFKLDSRVAELTSETLEIDPEPVFDPATNYWRIAVKNTSYRTLKVSVRVKGFVSGLAYGMQFPLPLQATHQAGTFKVGVGPSNQQLFDLCIIDDNALIFVGPPSQQVSLQWESVLISAYSDDRAFDERRFNIARHARGFWELRATH